MSRLPPSLRQDRALRKAAWEIVRQDISHVQADLEHRSVGQRIGARIKAKAVDLAEDATDLASRNKGMVAAGAAALVLWFARNPIRRGIGKLMAGESDHAGETEDEDS